LVNKTGLEWLSNNSDYLVQYILAAIYIIQVVIVRLIVIICAIPVFIVLNIFICYLSLNAFVINTYIVVYRNNKTKIKNAVVLLVHLEK
jgi:hypothetical protein